MTGGDPYALVSNKPVDRIMPGMWSIAYITCLSSRLLRLILAEQHGPLTPQEREAAELTLAMRVMEEAAGPKP